MGTVGKRLYEGLFLVDSGLATADWAGITGTIERILTKGGAEIVSLKKWDERKLTYNIEGKSRGTYILTYFNAETSALGGIERSAQLSEQIMRVLILRTDNMSKADIEKATPAMVIENQRVSVAAPAEQLDSAVQYPDETPDDQIDVSDDLPDDEPDQTDLYTDPI